MIVPPTHRHPNTKPTEAQGNASTQRKHTRTCKSRSMTPKTRDEKNREAVQRAGIDASYAREKKEKAGDIRVAMYVHLGPAESGGILSLFRVKN